VIVRPFIDDKLSSAVCNRKQWCDASPIDGFISLILSVGFGSQ
jgi:hypothetical protein